MHTTFSPLIRYSSCGKAFPMKSHRRCELTNHYKLLTSEIRCRFLAAHISVSEPRYCIPDVRFHVSYLQHFGYRNSDLKGS